MNGPNISVIRLQVYYHLISDSFSSNTKRTLYILYEIQIECAHFHYITGWMKWNFPVCGKSKNHVVKNKTVSVSGQGRSNIRLQVLCRLISDRLCTKRKLHNCTENEIEQQKNKTGNKDTNFLSAIRSYSFNSYRAQIYVRQT